MVSVLEIKEKFWLIQIFGSPICIVPRTGLFELLSLQVSSVDPILGKLFWFLITIRTSAGKLEAWAYGVIKHVDATDMFSDALM